MDESKFFEAAQSLAQSMSQWDLLIIGASMVIIVSTSYYRPNTRKMRAAYFLFLPAWALLALSIYQGIEIQSRYVAYLVAARHKSTDLIESIANKMNDNALAQIRYLELALVCLGGWLVVYILWWVLSDQSPKEKK
ncbi:MAG TPA: hypothetical protein VMB03_06055 [Bryobacteraceae bacterium]|nr:hypothetical protein [Bryobacteraceae bacterium]